MGQPATPAETASKQPAAHASKKPGSAVRIGQPVATGKPVAPPWTVTTITHSTPPPEASPAPTVIQQQKPQPQAVSPRRSYRWLLVPVLAALATLVLIWTLSKRGIAG
jgi:hypothetical protein